MGATVVIAWIRDRTALIAHMGDSRAYRVRDGRVEQLTSDHSLVQLLIDAANAAGGKDNVTALVIVVEKIDSGSGPALHGTT